MDNEIAPYRRLMMPAMEIQVQILSDLNESALPA